MKRTDTPGGRFYDAGAGRKLPSVTTILSALAKPALIGWAAKEERKAAIGASWAAMEEAVATQSVPNPHEWTNLVMDLMGPQKAHQKLMQAAATIGTTVHAWIEWQLRGEQLAPGEIYEAEEPPSDDPIVAECLQKWQAWRQSVDLKVLAVEQRLASQDYGFAGTLDLLAEVDGKVTVIDFKTGKAIYAEAYLQNCAYRLALSEAGVATEQGLIIRLPKDIDDPTFEVGVVPPMEELMVPFLCLIPVWRWMAAEEKAYRARRAAELEKARTGEPT